MGFSFKDSGIHQTMTTASKLAIQFGGESGIKRSLENLKTDAMAVTPVDTGKLIASFRIKVSTKTPNRVRGSLYNNTPYAVYVHEILGNHHPIGDAKYLERPFRKHVRSGRITNTIGEYIAKELK